MGLRMLLSIEGSMQKSEFRTPHSAFESLRVTVSPYLPIYLLLFRNPHSEFRNYGVTISTCPLFIFRIENVRRGLPPSPKPFNPETP